jgi:exonuclease SbcC
MRLNYIELRNYRRFEHVKLELPDGIIGIVGDNGVGKSTLVESIAWALFGNQKDIVRAGKESIRRDGAKPNEPTSVKLEFMFAGEEYVVTREMSGKALSIDAALLVSGREMARGSKEVSGYIEKKLGMDYKSFFISVFAKQKDLAALSSLTDSERRMTVLRMLGIDRLDDIIDEAGKTERLRREKVESSRKALMDESGRMRKDVLAERRHKLSLDQEAAEKNVLSLREKQTAIEKKEKETEQRYTEVSKKLKELRDANAKDQMNRDRLDSAKKNKEQAESNLREAEKAEREIVGLESLNDSIKKEKKKHEYLLSAKVEHERLVRLKEDRASLDKEIATIERENEKRTSEIKRNADLSDSVRENSKVIEDAQKELADLRGRQSELHAQSKSIKEKVDTDEEHLKEIERLGPDGVCPTCERPLREHQGRLRSKLAASIEKSKKSLVDLESYSKEYERKLNEQAEALESLKRRSEALAKKVRHFEQLKTEQEIASKSIKDLEAKRRKSETEIEKAESVSFDESELERTVRSLEEYGKRRDALMGFAALARKAPDLKRSFERLHEEIKKLEEVIQKSKMDPAEIEILETTTRELEIKKELLRTEIKGIYESIITATRQKENIDSEMAALEKDLTSIEETSRKLEVMEKDLAYAVKLQELMKEFKVNLVARIIPTLSDIASTLLSQLTEGRYNSLTLDDGYNIFIEDGGEKHILERFSGGESDLANLCLRLAVSRVIAERTGTEGINLLVLDEIFGSQDASRKRNLMTSFNALSKQFRQIFLITHVDDIREYLTSVIEVRKDEEGTSHAHLAQ